MRTLPIIAFMTFASLAAECQKQIYSAVLIEKPLFSMSSWADESGFVLLRFKYSSDQSIFILIHKELGEITRFDGKINIIETIGFCSPDTELTLFFRGSLDGKKDYYFLTFFKDGKRKPILTNWLSPAAGDYILSYQAFNKLFLWRSVKHGYEMVEVDRYDSVQTISFPANQEFKKLIGGLTGGHVAQLVYPNSNWAYGRKGHVQIYPYADSLTIIKWGGEIVTLNFSSKRIRQTLVDVPVDGFANSLMLKDRFVQLAFGKRWVNLRVYAYPALTLLKEYRYTKSDSLTIRAGFFRREEGWKNMQEKWISEKQDPKTIARLASGIPFLSLQVDSSRSLLRMSSSVSHRVRKKKLEDTSFRIFIGGRTTVYEGQKYVTYRSGTFWWEGRNEYQSYKYHLNCSLDRNGSPAVTNANFIWDTIDERNSHFLIEDNFLQMCESANDFFAVHYSNKSRTCKVEQFVK
jgi:hypothetical protein